MTVKCEYCDKTAQNRSGMSSHMKSVHPEKLLEWRKGSVMSSSDKKSYQAQLQALVEPARPETGRMPVLDTSTAEHKRQYQKSWYWRNKKKALARQKQLDDARRSRWDKAKQEKSNGLTQEKMHVTICPRCKCRFATMIIEEGEVA